MINIKTLEYIIAVDKYKSFKKASEECFVSQPALSMQIKKLEESISLKIFERDNKNIFTTKSGLKIINQAKKIHQEIDTFRKLADKESNKDNVSFSIGAFPTLCPYIMPTLLPKIKEKLPQNNIYIIEEKSADLIKLLENGEIDFIFLADPLDNKSFIYKKIFSDEFLLAVNKKSKLAKYNSIAVSDMLNQKDFLLLADGHCLRDQTIELCSFDNRNKHLDSSNFMASSLETIRQMVAINQGITLIPKIACSDNKDIKYLKIDSPNFYRNIYLVMRKNSIHKDIYNTICDIYQIHE